MKVNDPAKEGVIEEMRYLVPAETTVYIGRPAKPVQADLVNALRTVVEDVPDIQEAHLPQCWVKGVMPDAGPILVLLVRNDADEVANQVERRIAEILPPVSHLDFWFMKETDPLLLAVRGAKCAVFIREPAP